MYVKYWTFIMRQAFIVMDKTGRATQKESNLEYNNVAVNGKRIR